MSRLTSTLAIALLATFLSGCGGGGGGGASGTQAQGQIQILSNVPTHITRIDVGPTGSAAPKQDQLNGVLLSGSGFTVALPPGLYDLDVFVFGTPFGVVKHYSSVAVGPGQLTTLIVVP